MSSYYEKILATGEVKCIDEEIPFEVPKGWEWCRLRDIILGTNAGKSPNCEKRPKKSEEWGVLTTTSIQENAFLSNENKVLPKHYVINPGHCVRYGDILITRAGPVNRTGIVCMVENNCDKLILSDKTVRIDYMHDYCNPKFLVFVLNSSAIHELVMSATVGMAASQVNVSQISIQNTLIPFPPSKEQQRIINKLEALLPQIEKYDNAQNKLDELNKIVKDIIKKSVLQEAIQGRLVSQLEEEGTAKELLEQIKAEKQKLVKEGKLKKSALINSIIFRGDDNKYYEQIGKTVTDISEEIPFSIPDSWAWSRLSGVVNIIMGQSPDSNDIFEADEVNNAYEFHQGKISFTDKYIAPSGKWCKRPSRIADIGSLLVCVRAPIGDVNITQRQIGIGRGLAAITGYKGISPDFLFHWLLAHKKILVDKGTGSTFKAITVEVLKDLIIPTPPLGEQQRIVNHIETLYDRIKG